MSMWKAVSRSICEAVERRVGFTVFRCDASKSNCQDVPEGSNTSPCQLSSITKKWKRFCPSNNFNSAHKNSENETQSNQRQENKHHEDKWDEPFANHPWLGAMGWSTALFLGWYMCQPSGWGVFKDNSRWCLFQKRGKQHPHTARNNAFTRPAVQPFTVLPINAIHDGSQSLSSTPDSADTGVAFDAFDDMDMHKTPSLSSSTDTGVSIDEVDELFSHRRGPFTPEEALNEASRVFAAASRSFTGDVENKMGMVYMEKRQHVEALKHFRRASRHDNANAAYNIGQCYELGLGTSQNMKKAAKWYKIASDRGHSIAMYNLAVFFAQGLGGLVEDKQHAYDLLRTASNLGLKEAQVALLLLEVDSKGTSKESSIISHKSNSASTEALLEMLGVGSIKPDDETVQDPIAVGITQPSINFSHMDCLDFSLTSLSDQGKHIGKENPYFCDGFGLRRRWGLNRLCVKLPVDHDTAVA